MNDGYRALPGRKGSYFLYSHPTHQVRAPLCTRYYNQDCINILYSSLSIYLGFSLTQSLYYRLFNLTLEYNLEISKALHMVTSRFSSRRQHSTVLHGDFLHRLPIKMQILGPAPAHPRKQKPLYSGWRGANESGTKAGKSIGEIG